MNRYIRYAALLGTCLLGSACEKGTAPAPSAFYPQAQMVARSSVKLETRIAGLAWDPEAYFIALAGCAGSPSHPVCTPCPDCTPPPEFPPFISEGLPTFLRASVTNTAISAWDPLTEATVGNAFTSTPDGFFEVEGVPSRDRVPFFLFTAGQGTIAQEPDMPEPQIAPTTYLPTVALRPINTAYATCTSQEAILIGRNGVLEAVAKYLTSQGRPTVVSDFLDRTRYHSVAVIATHHAGNQALRAPADGISLEGTQGEVFVLDWDALPADSLRSQRGFIVTSAQTSPVGFYVVLMRATVPRPETISYKFKDTITDAAAKRPWRFPTIEEPPHAGVVTYIGAQMQYPPPPIPQSSLGVLPSACLPF